MADRRKKHDREEERATERTHLAQRATVGSVHSGVQMAENVGEPAFVHHVEVRTVSGPMPTADELARYGEVFPDAAAILFAEFEKEGDHRRRLQMAALHAEIASEYRGQQFALAVLLAGLAAGIGFALAGHPTLGATIVGVDLTGAASLFIYGRHERREERQSMERAGLAT
jgi:uncharacterized membrane protein